MTIGVVATSLAIGAFGWVFRGEIDFLRDSLMIAGCLLLISWMVVLFTVTLLSIPEVALWSFRRLSRWTSRKPKVGGGLADEWLDGPT